jgi:hypothetical protein
MGPSRPGCSKTYAFRGVLRLFGERQPERNRSCLGEHFTRPCLKGKRCFLVAAKAAAAFLGFHLQVVS